MDRYLTPLEKRQEEMRLRVLRKKEEERKPATKEELLACTNCKKRQARKNSHLCSRCTQSELQNSLRDTLPGLAPTYSFKQPEEVMQDDIQPHRITPAVEGDYGASSKTSDNIIEVLTTRKQEVLLEGLTSDNPNENPPLFSGVAHGPTFSRTEVCRLIGVRPKTLGNWEKKGKVPLPRKLAHNNQYVYTDENIKAIKAYMTAEVDLSSTVVKTVAKTLDQATSKLSLKSTKRVERAVASKLSGFHRGSLI